MNMHATAPHGLHDTLSLVAKVARLPYCVFLVNGIQTLVPENKNQKPGTELKSQACQGAHYSPITDEELNNSNHTQ